MLCSILLHLTPSPPAPYVFVSHKVMFVAFFFQCILTINVEHYVCLDSYIYTFFVVDSSVESSDLSYGKSKLAQSRSLVFKSSKIPITE